MGKSIRIYLADGTVSGIRHGEIANWTGQALACPRSRFQELSDWAEVQRPGVYFLFGVDEETSEDVAYIGESELVLDRMHSHISGKDFWSEMVAFTSKDDNLTKAHVRYLESRLIAIAQDAGRYRVKNSASPQLPALPRADRDAMEEYLGATRVLLGVLGHRVLEPVLVQGASVGASEREAIRQTLNHDDAPVSQPDNPIFMLRTGDLRARATPTDEGIVVLADSEAAASAQGSLSGGYRGLRDKLIESEVLVPSGAKLRLTKNQLFSSPSQAAAVLVGYAVNGRDAWRLPDGTSYAVYEKRLSDSLLQQISAPK